MRGRECIGCNLCNCGRQQCPHNRKCRFDAAITKQETGQSVRPGTEYDTSYQSWNAKPRKPVCSIKRPSTYPKMDCVTSYNRDYTIYPKPEQRNPCPPQNSITRLRTIIPTKTVYTDEYNKAHAVHTSPKRPTQAIKRIGGLTKQPTPVPETRPKYQMSTEEMQGCRPGPAASQHHSPCCTAQGDGDQHTGSTITQNDYKDTPVQPRPYRRPVICLAHRGGFNHDTSYRLAYKANKTRPPVIAGAPTSHSLLEGRAFQDETTVKADYQPYKNIKPVASCKPVPRVNEIHRPFKSGTVHRDTYTGAPNKRPDLCFKQAPYTRPREKMNDSTIYRDNYLDLLKYTPKHDVNTHRCSIPRHLGNFQDKTSYRYDYEPPRDGQKAKSCRLERVYEPPKHTFESNTTQRASYKGEYTPKAIICRPGPPALPTEDVSCKCDTIYGHNYQERQSPPPCPASCHMGIPTGTCLKPGSKVSFSNIEQDYECSGLQSGNFPK